MLRQLSRFLQRLISPCVYSLVSQEEEDTNDDDLEEDGENLRTQNEKATIAAAQNRVRRNQLRFTRAGQVPVCCIAHCRT